MKYGGIDPGQNGGLAVLDDSAHPLFLYKLDKGYIDIRNGLSHYRDALYYVEDVWSRPGNGVKAAFTYGFNIGELHSAINQNSLIHEMIYPKDWQNHYNIKKEKTESKTEFKGRLKELAQYYFPNANVTLWNADALLIALYNYERNSV